VGIITTGAKADMVAEDVIDRIYAQMATLNKTARDIMVQFSVHSCTDVTGFGLIGHSFEMAQGSNCTVHIQVLKVPYHSEALELASMGLVPAGAYRNREYAQAGVTIRGNISLATEDILYDPQTSGGLLFAIPAEEAESCISMLKQSIPNAAIIGYVTEKEDSYIILE
jgi:selenide,water dikinase